MGETEPDEPDGVEQQQVDRAPYVVVGQVASLDPRRAAGVHDEHIDAAEALDRRGDEPLEVGGIARVARDREPSQASRLALEHVAPPGEHGHVCALGRERLGDAETDPGGGAADDGRAAAETEFHG